MGEGHGEAQHHVALDLDEAVPPVEGNQARREVGSLRNDEKFEVDLTVIGARADGAQHAAANATSPMGRLDMQMLEFGRSVYPGQDEAADLAPLPHDQETPGRRRRKPAAEIPQHVVEPGHLQFPCGISVAPDTVGRMGKI